MNDIWYNSNELDVVDEWLAHYGVGHEDNGNSGRYRWGSGDNPMQRDPFLSKVKTMQNKGYSEKSIAEYFGLSTTAYRTQYSLAKDLTRRDLVKQARKLRDSGMSLKAIADEMGFKNDSSVRTLLNENTESKMNQALNAAEFLKSKVDEKGAIDIGPGVEASLNMSREKMKEALYILEMEGYPTYIGGVPQATNPGQQTNMTGLCPPGTSYSDFFKIIKSQGLNSVDDYTSPDGGDTFEKRIKPPISFDSSRLQILYDEDGGTAKDGLIELRPGVDDLNMGGKNYAQVRILVDDTKYIKGMAVYSNDLPDGVDIRVNSNKHKEDGMAKALKDIKDDPDNPFGALINAQNSYTDADGNIHQGVLNLRAQEGDWNDWADALPSQFLSKQSLPLIRKQLKLTADDKMLEYKEITEVTNPVVKQQLLMSFADDCDGAAVNLKAVALPRQKYNVILPMNSLNDNECYAPNYNDGDTLALIRYPHGGLFEIPIVKVNNNNKEGKNMIGNNPLDAIGINKAVADRLSGADFDGDTVMAIPITPNTKILNKPPLPGLKDFDTKMAYGISKQTDRNSIFVQTFDEMKKDNRTPEEICEAINKNKKIGINVTPETLKDEYKKAKTDCIHLMKNTGKEMGVISNLITDMTLLGATDDELERAVKHSMVVIDAEKHHLNYQKSYADNNIEELKHKYQMKIGDDGKIHYGGAGTLISAAKGEQSVVKRQGQPKINIEGKPWYDPTRPEGALIYKPADNAVYVDYKTGKEKIRTQASTKMAETDNAMSLVSPARTAQELAYADYANKMKALANKARKEAMSLDSMDYSPVNNKIYAKEVSELKSALNIAMKNKPRERQAQLYANAAVEKAKQDDPKIKSAELKKIGQKALTIGRDKYGAKGGSSKIFITDNQWKAIQSGAITSSFLKSIMSNCDKDRLRDLATPKTVNGISETKQARIKQLANNGYTNSQIANYLGVSVSTVSNYING